MVQLGDTSGTVFWLLLSKGGEYFVMCDSVRASVRHVLKHLICKYLIHPGRTPEDTKNLKDFFAYPFTPEYVMPNIINSIFEEIFEMANKKKSARKNSFGEFTFYTLNLSQEQRDLFEQMLSKPDTLMSSVAGCIENGFKLSLSYDDYNECFTASLTCRDESSPNNQKIVTARHNTWDRALLLVAFKVDIVLGYAAWKQQSDDEDNWG